MGKVKESKEYLQHLEQEIIRHRDLYYNDQPEITDAEFDDLVDELKTINPENLVLQQVGATPKKREVKLDHAMGSLDKKSDPQELRDWFKKHDIVLVVLEEKLDGASLEIKYTDGKLNRMVTRGDGTIGRDATHHADTIIGVPKSIPTTNEILVRGEVIMDVADFEAYNKTILDEKKKAKNPRNLANGTLNADDPRPDRKLKFIACSVIGSKNEFEHQDLKALSKMGFNVVTHKVAESAEEVLDIFNGYHKYTRQSLPYWIDGMVVKIDSKKEQESIGYLHLNPRFACAIKFPAEEVVTQLKDIEWNLTNHGILAPRGVLEPVQLAGTTVSYAYLNNINFINQRGVQIGDYVRIKKGGDIIPYVIGLEREGTNRKGTKTPSVCPKCGEKLTFGDAYISCPNPSCGGKGYGILRNWIKKIEVDQLGDASLNKIIDAELVEEPADLYNLTEKQLVDLLGKIGQTIYSNIQGKRVLKLKDVFGSTMIDGAGRSTFEDIIDAGFDTPEKIFALTEKELAKVNGFSDIKAAKVVGGLNARRKILDNLLQKITLEKQSQNKISAQALSNSKVAGKSFCITGTLSRKKELVYTEIEANGGIKFEDVKKGLDFLIAADPNSGSNKLTKATKMGIKVISEEELEKMLMG